MSKEDKSFHVLPKAVYTGMVCMACLLGNIQQAEAQFTISGTVLEADGKTPVDYASVYLVGSYTGAYTDSTGSFTLQTPQLTDSLSISQPGYFTETIWLIPFI